MIKLEIVSVRRIDISPFYQFFNSDMGIKEYIKENFQDTGKLVSISNNISEDYTTETKTLVFESQNSFVDFTKDEVLRYQNVLRDRYNIYHNIKINELVTEI
jgi:hypothetical protein